MIKQPGIKYEDLMKSMSKETGIRLRTIETTVSEYKRTRNVKSPPCKQKCPTINYKINDYGKNTIRQKIQSFWLRHEIPTFQKILQVIMNDSDFSNISERSLKRALKDMSFKYSSKKNPNCPLIERGELVLMRLKYVEDIRRYRDEGRTIYYLDEMCVNTDDCTSNVGIDTKLKSQRNSFLDPPSKGLKNPTTKGNFMIVVHIGSTEHFVEGGLLCYKSKNKVMNNDTFYKWFCGVLPRLNDNCIIVMDNASYHLVKKEPIPTMDWTKENIIKWLVSKNCSIDDKLSLKCQLMKLVDQVSPLYDKYLIDEEALKTNKVVLHLPPYHNELNPFELAWPVVKCHLEKNNTTYKLTDVQKLLSDGVQLITPDLWANFVNQTIKEEDKLYKIDWIIDEMLDADDAVMFDTSDFSD